MNSSPFQQPENRGHSSYAPASNYEDRSRMSSSSALQAAREVAPPAVAPEVPAETPKTKPVSESESKLARELSQFNEVVRKLKSQFVAASTFESRCEQAFDVANDMFGHAPTWICFYRELMGGSGMLHSIFTDAGDFGRFLRSDQHHQIQLMLTALRSRDLPENDPNDPQRMITVRLPKSLHEAMCDEAARLNISVNRLCISRMLQLLDPKMIPESHSKPRGRKPRTRSKITPQSTTPAQHPAQPQSQPVSPAATPPFSSNPGARYS